MEERGYNVERFRGEVREDLRCSFCLNVPEEARLCQNHDHFFCFAHISHHLQNSGICPVCREDLTPETLRRPTGFIKNYLDDLMISCEYRDRGCLEHVRLESLVNHVDQCGFAPVMCENEGCGMEINKSDKKNHEEVDCKFRIARCHDCRDIKATQDQMHESQNVVVNQLNELITSHDDVGNIRDAMKESEDKMKASFNQLKRKLDRMRASQDEELKKVKVDIDGIKKNQDSIYSAVEEIKDNVVKIKQTQDDMIAKMNEQSATMTAMMNLLKPPTTVDNDSYADSMDENDDSNDDYSLGLWSEERCLKYDRWNNHSSNDDSD